VGIELTHKNDLEGLMQRIKENNMKCINITHDDMLRKYFV
jgi:hypothetical protein